ncbi:MAG: DUF2817 domain-containing protein [Cyanobacteria bacterium J06623_7]
MSVKYPNHFYLKYSQARNNFLAAAEETATSIESWQHLLRGMWGEKLYVDLAWFGDRQASKVLVLLSGVHGVEGYCGSGIQVGSIRTGWQLQADDKVAIAMVHGLNPHGMSYLRRVNEDGVDLNRNFIDFHQPLPQNSFYEKMAEVIVPPEWTEVVQRQTQDRLMEFLLQTPTAAADLARGQYQYWYAPFYGGEVPTWSNRVWQQICDRYLVDKSALGLLDYHTGLGQQGTGQLICLPNTSGTELAQSIWGDKVVITGSANSVAAYIPTGTLVSTLHTRLNRTTCVTAVYEFGTIPEPEVFQALRADHWLYRHGDLNTQSAVSIAQNMLDAFYVDSLEWRKSVCELAFTAQDELLAGLRSL